MAKETQKLIKLHLNKNDYKVKIKLAKISERYYKLALTFKR